MKRSNRTNQYAPGRVGLYLAAFLFAAPALPAQLPTPPVAGRPTLFSGAIGSRFRIEMRAAPKTVHAEEPLILTVRITGTGNLAEVPRPDLQRLQRFADQFQIEELTERALPVEQAREFDYRLRPRHAGVKEIPPLPFVYFNPRIQPREKGYQTTLAAAIPLTVQPRANLSPARVEGPPATSALPASITELIEGPVVLGREPAAALSAPAVTSVLLLAPPLLGTLWYLVWCRCYPDQARQARTRRSRAAQQALHALQHCPKHAPRIQAEQAAAILVGYLQQRLAGLPREPTPVEVARHLEQAGASSELAGKAARFFADCAAVRFAPGFQEPCEPPTEMAKHFLNALEEEPWPA